MWGGTPRPLIMLANYSHIARETKNNLKLLKTSPLIEAWRLSPTRQSRPCRSTEMFKQYGQLLRGLWETHDQNKFLDWVGPLLDTGDRLWHITSSGHPGCVVEQEGRRRTFEYIRTSAQMHTHHTASSRILHLWRAKITQSSVTDWRDCARAPMPC